MTTRNEEDASIPSPTTTTAQGAKPAGQAAVATTQSGAATAVLGNVEISSPHELTDWVDSVLEQLESRFETMNEQVVKRMKEMSDRIDALETSIEDLIVGATAPVGVEK